MANFGWVLHAIAWILRVHSHLYTSMFVSICVHVNMVAFNTAVCCPAHPARTCCHLRRLRRECCSQQDRALVGDFSYKSHSVTPLRIKGFQVGAEAAHVAVDRWK